MIYLWFLIGLVIIVKSSDVFLDSAIWLARTFKLPEVVVGATIVSICTVLPETVISFSASIHHNSGLAFGNAAGSMICNVGVVLAIGLLVKAPTLSFVSKLKKNTFILIGLILSLILCFALTGQVSRSMGIALLLILGWYLWENSHNNNIESVVVVKKGKLGVWVMLLIVSALGIAFGSHVLVVNGEKIAISLGVPPLIIGLTLTAIGSSLPELVTCIASISKGVADISIGNIIGANILNACLVISASALANPIILGKQSAIFNLVWALIFAFYLLLCFHRKSKKLYRLDGVALLAIYGIYLAFSIFTI